PAIAAAARCASARGHPAVALRRRARIDGTTHEQRRVVDAASERDQRTEPGVTEQARHKTPHLKVALPRLRASEQCGAKRPLRALASRNRGRHARTAPPTRRCVCVTGARAREPASRASAPKAAGGAVAKRAASKASAPKAAGGAVAKRAAGGKAP